MSKERPTTSAAMIRNGIFSDLADLGQWRRESYAGMSERARQYISHDLHRLGEPLRRTYATAAITLLERAEQRVITGEK